MIDQPSVLIVDDDQELSDLLVEALTSYGYRPVAVHSGQEMRQALSGGPFNLILLDIMMPGEDGLDLCRALKTPGSPQASTPVIFLTALKDTADTVVGLELGADDYLAKPFQTRELIARVRAVLRRAQASPGQALSEVRSASGSILAFADWKLNAPARHLIDKNGVVVPLSAAEFRLLSLFLDYPQQVITRERILESLAMRNLNIYDRSVDSQVSRLRAKLRDKEMSIIRTMRGDGYLLATPVERGTA
ncbi:MAG: response regulator transcription factor [Deltaproteobacteria bacterium]|jgi:two-component system OmpR family response regulator|nr:response regulator transcription factor [Deltaproteobacteria bacterium]